jgi:hypothetical protein
MSLFIRGLVRHSRGAHPLQFEVGLATGEWSLTHFVSRRVVVESINHSINTCLLFLQTKAVVSVVTRNFAKKAKAKGGDDEGVSVY